MPEPLDPDTVGPAPTRIAVRHRRLLWGLVIFLLLSAFSLAVAASFVPYFAVDLWLTRRLQQFTHPVIRRLMIAVSWPGYDYHGFVVTLGAAGLLLTLRLRLEAACLAASAGLGSLITTLVKLTIARSRPTAELVDIYVRHRDYELSLRSRRKLSRPVWFPVLSDLCPDAQVANTLCLTLFGSLNKPGRLVSHLSWRALVQRRNWRLLPGFLLAGAGHKFDVAVQDNPMSGPTSAETATAQVKTEYNAPCDTRKDLKALTSKGVMLDQIQRMISGELPLPPVARLIGFKITKVEPGQVACTMESEPEQQANPLGTIHGGVLCDLTDAAMGLAYASTLRSDESFTTLELKIQFLPAGVARNPDCRSARCHTRADRRPRGVFRTDERGRLIAKAGSHMSDPSRRAGAGR